VIANSTNQWPLSGVKQTQRMECPLMTVGSIGRCNTSIKSRSARVSKPKVSRDRSLSCRATRLNCGCAPPAVPQLLLGHRVEPSNISSTHRPSTPSLASGIKCCVDRLRPPPTTDIRHQVMLQSRSGFHPIRFKTSASRMRQRDFFAGVRRRGRHHSLAASRGRARRVLCLRSNPALSTMWFEPVRCWPLT